MTGNAYSAILYGTVVHIVEIEVDISSGIPTLELTGNLGGTVKEARERVRSAIKNTGINIKPARITINFAPSNLRKEGTQFDLGMAVAIMSAYGIININNEEIVNTVFMGELGLNGRVNPVNAVLPVIAHCAEAGIKRCIVPRKNMKEGSYILGIEVIGVDSLAECLNYLKGNIKLEPVKNVVLRPQDRQYEMDFSDIRGQKSLKRAMLIAVGAMHNILMVGPPGAGKTMTASRLVTIMPSLKLSQCIEISKIYSIAGLLNEDNYFITQRPFRSPNYSITKAAMNGGGKNPLPGEMSLANYGVLFLDELNMFTPDVIETLRIPLEKGRICINRVSGIYEFPAEFMLVGAINPCKCGYYPDRNKCNCSEHDIRKHMGRISRPLMDRIDMCVNAPKVQYEEIENTKDIEEDNEFTSLNMKKQILRIHEIQQERFKNYSFNLNSQIPNNLIAHFCDMENDAKILIKSVYDKYDLTARSYHKIIKVARTIADIEGHEKITLPDISEAVGYRMFEIY